MHTANSPQESRRICICICISPSSIVIVTRFPDPLQLPYKLVAKCLLISTSICGGSTGTVRFKRLTKSLALPGVEVEAEPCIRQASGSKALVNDRWMIGWSSLQPPQGERRHVKPKATAGHRRRRGLRTLALSSRFQNSEFGDRDIRKRKRIGGSTSDPAESHRGLTYLLVTRCRVCMNAFVNVCKLRNDRRASNVNVPEDKSVQRSEVESAALYATPGLFVISSLLADPPYEAIPVLVIGVLISRPLGPG
ncbi:hypothetical protein CVT25_009312 [Psilocybe cyanescens]|uniref:Uncharacterized protein n=1 Tax=Psilocybe cyanescens TaxID=93625 RepID=A0A409XDJ2_PSICY|nr:hypothetical protein CVT25_009312 [Psilocybe cyanescens]